MEYFHLRRVKITDLELSDHNVVENGKLYINANELRSMLLEDRHIKDVQLEVARPGESTRIVPIKDILEPRSRLSDKEESFEGNITDVNYQAGTGTSIVIDGVCIITSGNMVNFQEGLVDMSGPGADFNLFSKKYNLVLVITPADGITKNEHERAVRLAGIRAARYVGDIGRSVKDYKETLYPVYTLEERYSKFAGLPKVLYVCQAIAEGLLHDNYIYGVNAQGCLPLLCNPTELMDGVVISGNCAAPCHKHTTYHHQNNPIVEDLFSEDGKTLNFLGVVVAPVKTAFAEKERIARQILKTAQMLDANAAIVSEDGGGNPEADLMMTARYFEKAGIKTVLVTDEYAGSDGASAGLADVTPEADAVVTNGNGNQRVILPPMKKVIGVLDAVDHITGGHTGSLLPDGSIDMEIAGIMGSTNELGIEHLRTIAI
jgi:glycine reductase